jgi:hypothetical protein
VQPFAIQTVGNQGVLEMMDTKEPLLYEIKVHIALAYGKVSSTRNDDMIN